MLNEHLPMEPPGEGECPQGMLPPECVAPRLRPLLPLLAEGRTNQEIADELCLELQTVKNYVSEIREACGGGSRAQVAMRIEKCLARRK